MGAEATETTRGRLKSARTPLVLAAVLVIPLTYGRIYFGVDVSDEAIYLEFPYRFGLGARPFVDEIAFQQTAGVLLYPFVEAYTSLVGLDGLVLFGRHLHIGFLALVAATVAISLRRYLNTRLEALAIALMVIAVVPFSIFGLSYNTLGAGFFCAGCYVGLDRSGDREPKWLFSAGLLHGLAVFAYPSLLIALAAYGVALYLTSSTRSFRRLLPYLSGSALPILALGVLLLQAGFDQLRHVADFQRDVESGGSLGELRLIAENRVEAFPLLPVATVVLIGVFIVKDRRPRLALALLASLPFLSLPEQISDLTPEALEFSANFGLFAPALFYLVRESRAAQLLFWTIWAPSFVAGWAMSWTSTNGSLIFGLGLLPGAIATAVLLIFVIDNARRQADDGLVLAWVRSTVMVVPAIVLLALLLTNVYRDEGLPDLDAQVSDGPYTGLMTTSAMRDFIETAGKDFASVSSDDCSILFHYDFPAGYLLSPARPETNSVALYSSFAQSVFAPELRRYYREEGRYPDIITRMLRRPPLRYPLPNEGPDPIDRLLGGRTYRPVLTRAHYRIYVRRGSSCLENSS